jgi:hypothetical protein
MIEAGLFALFSQDAGVSAIVADRIYPILLPTGAIMPAITWQIVAGQTTPGLTTRGMQRWRLQVDCWSKASYLEAASIRSAVIQLLNLRNAQLVDGTYLQAAVFIQPIDFFSGGDELFRCGAEFYLYFHFPA